jgi:hypothetical protein
MAGLSLGQLRDEFPDIEIEKLEILTNRVRAREDGVRQVPALVHGERRLSGLFLTKKKIRQFLESV